jgi:VIT1/CCC1 family predicted Fe2+/Mn2+ transporter
LIALAGFGAVKGRYTGIPPLRAAFQTALVGGAAAGMAYVIARLLSSLGGPV